MSSGTVKSHPRLPSDGKYDSLRGIRHVIADRDGVLNEELENGGYLRSAHQFRWLPGTLHALADLHALRVRVSVATNQSGIGRGVISESELDSVHRKMSADTKTAGGSIDAIFYCPHAPDAQCSCRKPHPGMLITAIAQSGIPADHTLVVGDAAVDLDAARSAGARAVLVRTGKGRTHESYATTLGIDVYDDLEALVAAIVQRVT
jgi:D-glycero-D-manno-heptose 1,7-bisphosphate phosphatase